MIEKERKFALKWMPKTISKNEIKQAYLLFEENKHLRVRIIDDTYAYLTLKTMHSAQIRTEYEYSIPLSDAYEMFISSKIKLTKTRYKTLYNGNCVDIDIFPNGMSVVEIEYEDELTELPEYCGEEITGVAKYSNVSIALLESAIGFLRSGEAKTQQLT